MKATVRVSAPAEGEPTVKFTGAVVTYVGRGVGTVTAARYSPDGESIELDLDLADDIEIRSIVRSYSVPS